MQHNTLIKIYGLLSGVSEKAFERLKPFISEAISTEESLDNSFTYNKNKQELNCSFEGLYFPFEDFLQELNLTNPKNKNSYPLNNIFQDVEGRLDYIDIENWNLTRLIFQNHTIQYSTTPLNNILAYSGH
ncbi:hypothetical protein [Desulfovibrio litoralis]|uniref:Uncharacterized protein n=1 Tax=Desulfovibrio litoralis DSM 11393 TaxID=1121455 RepID=A0A1M7RXB2_9BACT|nr:hypothetical protein [Desulfovibrio litoralis]SHN50672.1 hypothetical protein SAMN02745728_00273 [Desulfovibrio litoralis DSM 11393]